MFYICSACHRYCVPMGRGRWALIRGLPRLRPYGTGALGIDLGATKIASLWDDNVNCRSYTRIIGTQYLDHRSIFHPSHRDAISVTKNHDTSPPSQRDVISVAKNHDTSHPSHRDAISVAKNHDTAHPSQRDAISVAKNHDTSHPSQRDAISVT